MSQVPIFIPEISGAWFLKSSIDVSTVFSWRLPPHFIHPVLLPSVTLCSPGLPTPIDPAENLGGFGLRQQVLGDKGTNLGVYITVWGGNGLWENIHPGRWTWTMSSWRFGSDHVLFKKWVICRFHVNLPGCTRNAVFFREEGWIKGYEPWICSRTAT